MRRDLRVQWLRCRMGILILLAACVNTTPSGNAIGQTLNSTSVTGPSQNRVDIMFIGDGYQAHELDTYERHIASMLNHMLVIQEPFNRYANYFNVHRIELFSAESGADRAPDGHFVDTALDARYYFNGETDRLLYISERLADRAISAAINGTNIDVDMRFVTINETRYGGMGGRYAAFAGGSPSAYELALHEVAHSFSRLGDEYILFQEAYRGGEPHEVNLTIDPTGAEWAHWIGYQQDRIGEIGVYEGGGLFAEGIYRPSNNSKMRTLGLPFDAVAREQMVLDIYSHVDPLDDFDTNTATLSHFNRTIDVTPIDAELIELQWSVDGVTIPDFDQSSFNLSTISGLGFPIGDYEITLHAEDPTPWVRRNRETLQQSVTWQVAYRPGDLNNDAILTASDLNSLTDAVNSFTPSDYHPFYDINLDGVINTADRDHWMQVALTTYGDLNIDGEVDFADYLILSGHFGEDTSAYEDGDIDGNGTVDFADFLLLSGNIGFERPESPLPGTQLQLIPEPDSSLIALLAALTGLAGLRRLPLGG